MDVVYHPADQTYRLGGWTLTAQVLGDMLMTDRSLKNKTGAELAQILGDQLQARSTYHAPLEVTAFGDTNRNYLLGLDGTASQNVETTFRVGADGRPEAVTRLVDAPSKGAARNGGESEMAWLKRRVDEICWRF